MGVYPATQNLILAARSLGLGSTLGTYHLHAEAEVHRLLRLPPDVLVAATVAIGRPTVPFGRVGRRPVAEVLHWNGW
jgi:nitroreductase